jgi:biotin operon repressor
MITPDLARAIWSFVGHRDEAEIRLKIMKDERGRPFEQPITKTTHVSNATELLGVISTWNGKAQLWIGINERRPGGTKNEDVITIRNAVLDLEPANLGENEYPSEAQRQATLDVANKIRAWCAERGINTFIVDSGRGFHVWVPLKDIEVNDANREEIAMKYRLFYEHFRRLFSTDEVKIDATSDLARVVGIPYTVNVKWGRVRKPERPLERLPGDKATEFLLGLEPPRREAPKVEPSRRLGKPLTEQDLPPYLRESYENPELAGDRSLVLTKTLLFLANELELDKAECESAMEYFIRKIGRDRWPTGQQYDKLLSEGKIELRTAVRISDLSADLVGRKVIVDVQIVAERTQLAIPKKLLVECSKCTASEWIDVLRDFQILEAYVLKDRKPEAEAKQLFKLTHPPPCVDGGEHTPRVYEKGYVDYAILWVRDPLEKVGMMRFDKRAYEPREAHLVGQVVPNAKKIRLWARVALDKERRIALVADRVKPLESEIVNFEVSDEDRRAWREHFSNNHSIHREIAPHVVGQRREVAKKAVSLVLHSPPLIPDIRGQVIRGGLNASLFGDTATAKSATAKDVTDGSDSGWPVPLGTYVLAETGGRTGLLYTIDNDRHALVWGELVLNDLGLVVVDGLEQMSPEEFGEFREALRTGKISVRRSLAGDAWVRTRLIACFNPRKPMSQYLYPCQAITDTWTFENLTNITRWDLFVPFCADDVSPEEIASAKPAERPVPPEIFARHVLWVWSRRPDQIVYESEAAEEIKKVAKELIEAYSSQSLPIVSNETFATVCRLAVARAAERHSTDGKDEKIIVKPEHVRSAVEDFREVLALLKLGEYKLDEERKLQITDNEFASICMDLDEVDWKILDAVKFKGASSPVLEKELGLSERTIKTHFGKLKAHGLVETKPGVGVQITPRGIVFLRLTQIRGRQLPEKREGRRKLDTCELCHAEITGAAIYAEDGTRLCEKCAANYAGRV